MACLCRSCPSVNIEKKKYEQKLRSTYIKGNDGKIYFWRKRMRGNDFHILTLI